MPNSVISFDIFSIRCTSGLLHRDGVHWGMEYRMKTKDGILAKAKQHEQRAKAARDPENREWQMTLAGAYRMLAEAESEAAAQKNGLSARKMPSQSQALTMNAVPVL